MAFVFVSRDVAVVSEGVFVQSDLDAALLKLKKQFLYYAVASVTPIKGRTGLPALRALCEEDED